MLGPKKQDRSFSHTRYVDDFRIFSNSQVDLKSLLENLTVYLYEQHRLTIATEKTKIVLEAIKAEMTIAQISSKYGVHSTQIQMWKKRGIENLVNGFQVKPATKDPDNQDLIKQLYEQIGQLSVERDWLKKKSALFGLGN